MQQSHSIHLPTHLRLNFSKETDVTELRTCASVSSLTAVLVPDIVKFIVLSSGVMTGFHLGNWAVVLKCLGFLYTVATVNSHLPVALDIQPANLCNTHQGLRVSGSLYSIPSVNVNTGYAIHWWNAVVAMETSSFPPFTTTCPSQYVQACNYLMAISLKPLGLYMPSAVDLTVCTTHAIAFWRTASVQGYRRQLYCTGNIFSLFCYVLQIHCSYSRQLFPCSTGFYRYQ